VAFNGAIAADFESPGAIDQSLGTGWQGGRDLLDAIGRRAPRPRQADRDSRRIQGEAGVDDDELADGIVRSGHARICDMSQASRLIGVSSRFWV